MTIKTQHRDHIKTICENDVVLTFFISHPAYSPLNFSVSPPTVRLTDFPPHRLPEFLSPFCISPIIMAFKSDLMAFDFHLFLSKKTLRIARFAFLFIFCPLFLNPNASLFPLHWLLLRLPALKKPQKFFFFEFFFFWTNPTYA